MGGMDSAVILPLAGLAAGAVMGFAARASGFCTLAALERLWYAGDASGVRSWVLIAAVATLATQLAFAASLMGTEGIFYLAPSINFAAAIVGGIMFGFGMALVGTCAFGALVRLGGGSLRTLIVAIFIAIGALSAQHGLLAKLRVDYVDPLAVDLPGHSQALPALLGQWTGVDLFSALGLLLPVVALGWVFLDRTYRGRTRSFSAAFAVGLAIAAGWWITGSVAADSLQPVQREAGSFVSPLGETLLLFSAFTGTWPDYGIGLVFGVIAGATVAARYWDNVRWEACDDARELSRHMVGALLMGVGGVLALGCTIGQGVSAVSVLALSAPIVIASIALGARLGLALLLEGSIRNAFVSSRGQPGIDANPGE